MTKVTPIRIGFLHTHPIQYVAPLYQHLTRHWEAKITALYLSDYSVRGGSDRGFGRGVQWDIDLVEGYDTRFVRGAERRGEATGFLSSIAPLLWREIRSGGFDALIVHGHTPAAMVLAAAAAKASRISVLMRCETHLGLRRSRLKRLLRGPLIGSLYRRFDAVLAIGSANREFYRAMGVQEDRMFLMPYAVDNRRFMAASRLSAAERGEMRASLGVGDNRPIVLYAGKFQPRKRPDDLLRAAALLNREEMPFQLAMIGSGEMEPRLRTMAHDLRLTNVCFTGFVNQSALPRYYGACDVFVLPSVDEPWGLAINEAMCAGLPIVASSEIGCVPDLVRDGRNGRVFPAGNIAALAEALSSLIVDTAPRERMGQASREIISLLELCRVRGGAVGGACRGGRPRPPVARNSGRRGGAVTASLDAVKAENAADRHTSGLAIVGAFDGTHVGASLERAAVRQRMTVTRFDTEGAMRANPLLRAALWRLGGHRPARLDAFSIEVVAGCAEAQPKLLIATGAAPLTRSALRRLRTMGIPCLNYSTDDPWNKAMRASWYLRALPEYDVVFTTRSANLDCFRNIGVADVRYLPFGYDDELFPAPPEPDGVPSYDVLFVGGADDDRISFITQFLKSGLSVGLVGGYWRRCPATRPYALGLAAARGGGAPDRFVPDQPMPCAARQPGRTRHAQLRDRGAGRRYAGRRHRRAPADIRAGRTGGRLLPYSRGRRHQGPCLTSRRSRTRPPVGGRSTMRHRRRAYLSRSPERDAGGGKPDRSRNGVMSRHCTRVPPLRIAIATAGRFHVLDLARELHALGHRVRFYSYVPRSRARSFALPAECVVSLLPFALPALAWQRLAPGFLPRLRERMMYAALNYARNPAAAPVRCLHLHVRDLPGGSAVRPKALWRENLARARQPAHIVATRHSRRY